jgi:CHAT domain-containing protein/tetratricopeptide (TPR) repeat protein
MRTAHFFHFLSVKLNTRLSVVLLPILFVGCAVSEPRFEIALVNSGLPTRRALLRGETKEALAFYEAEARQAEKNAAASWFPQQDWVIATVAYREASRAAYHSGQLQKAIAHAEQALAAAEKTTNPTHQVRAVFELINANNSVRNFDRARELIEKGLGIAQKSYLNWWVSSLYSQLGRDLVRRGEYGEAVDALSQSLSMAEASLRVARRSDQILTQRTGVVMRLTALGDAYRRAGQLHRALEQYERAFSSIREWELRYPYEPHLYEAIGELYLQQNDFPQALESFRKALFIAENQQIPAGISSANRNIGDVLWRTGKPDEAIPHYQTAIQQIESIRSVLDAEKFRQSYFEGQLRAYVRMIDALLLSGKPEEAFNYSEHARSRVFLDVLGSRVQLARVKSGVLEEERALQERIAGLKARLTGEGDEEGIDRGRLASELRETEKAYNTFLEKVRKQDREQASLMTVEPLTLGEVQQLLDPGTTLIEYFVTERGIFIWVVEKEKVHFQRVALPKGDLGNSVKTLRESIYILGERQRFNEASALLYKQLIEPLLPHITGKELIIVPHDVLHYLPFHALVGPDGHYLIEKYPIYYLSSASLLQFVKEKRKAGGEKVLAFGNPDLGDPEKNLEYAELEAQEVKAVYPEASVLLKKEASEEKSKSLSPAHDILHFATHAQLNEDDPLSSAVLLAREDKEDGRLEVREIFGMDLKANLVVLSGCETGLGKLSTGDELVGLTRAFIYAGTPSVVASLWSVDDSSTAQLMASFYRNLKTMSKVEALRQAQLELIRGEGRSDLLARRGVGGIGKLGETPESPSQDPISISTSHPYFWAPFILVGDGK